MSIQLCLYKKRFLKKILFKKKKKTRKKMKTNTYTGAGGAPTSRLVARFAASVSIAGTDGPAPLEALVDSTFSSNVVIAVRVSMRDVVAGRARDDAADALAVGGR
jgi:hypothetical protein